ncbi:hypothetical protein [Bacillus sp. RO1]|uniref:hypothetical protein n=1 Tax=Bacillus sp. RO1 TaxID=2722703 RepID=UPI001F10EEF3|nr:hypothetical protein [Bacillus sp. RO1]
MDSEERISYLNNLVLHKNKQQQSNALMVYRYFDESLQVQIVWAYHFSVDGMLEERKAVCKEDEFGYFSMIFEEEFTETKSKRIPELFK